MSSRQGIPDHSIDISHHKRRRKEKFRPDFNIPGVYRLKLLEESQHFLKCVVGNTVTTEKPWIYISKALILEHLEMNPEESELLPVQADILQFPGDAVLVGYIPDEASEEDEFYFCVTEAAISKVNKIIDKIKRIQETRLQDAWFRKTKQWKSLGSEAEIDEETIKCNRSLLEVEIESKYPLLPWEIKLVLARADDRRDGYMELRPTETDSILVKRRIHNFAQVTPSVVTNEAQTVCRYPKHTFTQYEYELPEVQWESTAQFDSKNVGSLCDALRVNDRIDLYSNDYENLVLNAKYRGTAKESLNKDYTCYVDMQLCGGKMVSTAAWHPMWTGCVIASYVDIAPTIYLTSKPATDEVLAAVHDTNPVLFWSFDDDLKPKLVLETQRPVYSLSCCPHDPNLILGGCVNGQIILWDITNRLSNVEVEEILTVDQTKYRDIMFSLMQWMKNIYDITKVRPAALSDLQYSHRGCIRSITWMSPFHNVSKTGKIEQVSGKSPHSLQFITSAEDGTILFWDLLKKPRAVPGGFKSTRRTKRLKTRPTALMVMESPFKKLHLQMRPVYKLNLVHPSINRTIGITASYTNFFQMDYEAPPRDPLNKPSLSTRLIFKPLLKLEKSNTRPTFYVGTMEGDFIQGLWEGQKFDSGEVVNYENATIFHGGKYHDGPVVSVDYSPKNDTVLTVGGRVFAFWRETFQNRPILWRKCSTIYTYGTWFAFEHASIRLIRIDGYIEIWTMFYQSKTPLAVELMSNGAVNLLTTHPRRLKRVVLSLCDYRGSMRLFLTNNASSAVIQSKEAHMKLFLTSEIDRKQAFLKWQSSWNELHSAAEAIVEKNQEEVVVQPQATEHKDEKKKVVKVSPGMRYMEAVQEEHRKQSQEKIKEMILVKKNLNTEDLLKKWEPLRKLEEENEVKKKKQKTRLKESDNIFKGQVAMLFPDVVKSKPPPAVDPHEDHYTDVSKKECFDSYLNSSEVARDYVAANPFNFYFDWRNVITEGRERRKKLDVTMQKDTHKNRFAETTKMKVQATAQAAEAESEARERDFSMISDITNSSFYQ